MADKKIADLTEATTIADTDIVIVEDNANTKKMTWANLKTAIIGAFSSILGNRTYTEQNVVTNGESVTSSIDALDVAVADNVITSGSNENGSWTKFPDGTMICRKQVVFTNVGITGAWGSLYISSPLTLGNWSQAFIAMPEGYTISLTDTVGASGMTYMSGTPYSSSGCGSIILMRGTSTTVSNVTISITATGRWKA